MSNWKMNVSRIIFLIGFVFSTCLAVPLNNIFDTQPIYHVDGTDKFYKKRRCHEATFRISPFYSSCNTARNGNNRKVPAGDRLGPWNFFGVFFGTNAAPKPFIQANFPNDVAARNGVSAVATSLAFNSNTAPNSTPTPGVFGTDRYRGVPPLAGISPNQQGVDYAIETNFKPEREPWAYVSNPISYEKMGVRSQLNLDTYWGLGISIKGGVVDVKQKPCFVLDPILQADIIQIARPIIPPATTSTNGTEDDWTDARALYDVLYSPQARSSIARELDLNLDRFHTTAAEDIHVQVYWHIPIKMMDNTGDLAVTFVPYFAAGSWLPSGMKSDPNRPFSVPTGNDGFYGLTVDIDFAFLFPVLPKDHASLELNVGGGGLMCNKRDLYGVRVPAANIPNIPNYSYQVGFLPWTTSISNQPGWTWYFNSGVKAVNFLPGLTAVFEYMYTYHSHDDITLLETNPTRRTAFANGLRCMVEQSLWRNQQVNFSLDYKIAEALSLGGAIQAHITGTRVYRPVTVLAGITITF